MQLWEHSVNSQPRVKPVLFNIRRFGLLWLQKIVIVLKYYKRIHLPCKPCSCFFNYILMWNIIASRESAHPESWLWFSLRVNGLLVKEQCLAFMRFYRTGVKYKYECVLYRLIPWKLELSRLKQMFTERTEAVRGFTLSCCCSLCACKLATRGAAPLFVSWSLSIETIVSCSALHLYDYGRMEDT